VPLIASSAWADLADLLHTLNLKVFVRASSVEGVAIFIDPLVRDVVDGGEMFLNCHESILAEIEGKRELYFAFLWASRAFWI